jgi:hypothetical protein
MTRRDAYMQGLLKEAAQDPRANFRPPGDRSERAFNKPVKAHFDARAWLDDIYGGNLNKELAAAASYAKARGLPEQTSDRALGRPLPVVHGDGPAYADTNEYNRNAIQVPPNWDRWRTDNTAIGGYRQNGAAWDRFGGFPSFPYRFDVPGILGHEVAHSMTASPAWATYLSRANAAVNPAAPEAYAQAMHEGAVPDLTYPETSGNELVPPLSALQRHVYRTTGRRIQSLPEYRRWVKPYDRMDPDRIWQQRALPDEVKRLLSYRWLMQQRDPEIRKRYDIESGKLIPALTSTMATRNATA